MPQAYNTSTYHPQQQQYYEQSANFPPPPLTSHQTAYNGNYVPQTQNLPTSYSTQRWSAEQQGVYHQWESSGHPPSHVPTVSNLRSGAYPPHLHQWQAPPPSYVDAHSQAGFNRPMSPGYSYPAAGGSGGEFPTDVVPPPRRRVSPGSTRDHYSATSRAASNRPMGVLRCSSCKATQSPEWRKGPSGKKELCNA